jgi:hypothetical protein
LALEAEAETDEEHEQVLGFRLREKGEDVDGMANGFAQ